MPINHLSRIIDDGKEEERECVIRSVIFRMQIDRKFRALILTAEHFWDRSQFTDDELIKSYNALEKK